MTILIHAIGPDVIAYPATLDALRQEFPNCSFPIEPTAEDLAPFNRFPVTSIPAPSCDPRSERTEHQPTLTENGWQQAWSIRPATDEEIAAYDLTHQPEPDWASFKAVAMQSSALKVILIAAYQVEPVAAGALAPSLLRCETGDVVDFVNAWAVICAAVPVPADVIGGFVAMAEQCHLPAAFVAGLAPAAPDRERARDEEGRFIEDDPATPDVDEAWQ